MRKLSPHLTFLVCLAMYLAAAALACRLGTAIPYLGLSLVPAADGKGLTVASVDSAGPAQGKLQPGQRIVAVKSPAGTAGLDAALLLDNPDALPFRAQLRTVLARLDRVNAVLSDGAVTLQMPDGQQVALQPAPRRPLSTLPWRFWLPLLCSSLVFLFSAVVWAFRLEHAPGRHFGLSGALLMVIMLAGAVYGTRSLGMSGERVDHLLLLRHASSYFLVAALFNLSWTYPNALPGKELAPRLSTALAGIATVSDTLGLAERTLLGLWLPLLGGCIALTAAQLLQLRATRAQAQAFRRSLWVAAAMLIGIGVYTGGFALPLALDTEPALTRVAADTFLMLIYVVIAAGIYRLGLLDVDRWVLGVWMLFVGGLATAGLDAAVVLILGVQAGRTMAAVLAVLAWVYFPLRQAIWLRMTRRLDRRDFRQLAPAVFEIILEHESGEHEQDGWPAILRRVFAPLALERNPGYAGEVRLERGGEELWLPAIKGSAPLILRYADRGYRLFTREDRRMAVLLLDFVDRLRQFRVAVEIGAESRRLHVAKALHDHVVPPVLSMVYRAPDSASAASFRELLQQLRDTVRSLDQDVGSTPTPFGHAAR